MTHCSAGTVHYMPGRYTKRIKKFRFILLKRQSNARRLKVNSLVLRKNSFRLLNTSPTPETSTVVLLIYSINHNTMAQPQYRSRLRVRKTTISPNGFVTALCSYRLLTIIVCPIFHTLCTLAASRSVLHTFARQNYIC